jgi:hypothetical protein
MSEKRWMCVLLALSIAGCGDSATIGSDKDLRFEDVQCVPNVLEGKAIVEGQSLSCTFRVEGRVGREASVRCEDASGGSLDCSAASRMQIQPFGSNPLPIKDGLFIMQTDGRANQNVSLVWVADDGEKEARRRVEFAVSADDGVNAPPSIEFNCAGDTDGAVRAAAGAQLVCQVRLSDPDPDTLSWSYTQTAGPAPANEPTPFGGSGQAPLEFTWRWSTVAAEAGKSWTYRFTVNDGTAPAVTRELVISAE